ncbi:MAG: very short patch repair endonuclease [Chromatiales bacterium]|nr:very short patch repair endonuclease [Chromatiales bacterium]
MVIARSMTGDRMLAGERVDRARSALMGRVPGKNTKPELVVRREAHALGYRFRLHRKDLPGTPDLVFPRLRKALFVHGCFWHRHEGCSRTTTPKTRAAYWQEKFERNVQRDRRNVAMLEALGWKVLVIWECETFDRSVLVESLSSFLASSR